MTALDFWNVTAPTIRTKEQEAAILAVQDAANQIISEIDRQPEWGTEFCALFHLKCSHEKCDEHNYFRDHTGTKTPIRYTRTIFRTARWRA